jgi:hypothetical protein
MQVKCTTDYGMFTSLNINRDLDMKHVKNLAERMKVVGFDKYTPIHVNSEMVIMDGHHRHQAAMIAGVPIYYLITDDLTLDDVRIGGKLHRAWTSADYVRSYAKSGNEACCWFEDFRKQYGISFNAALS